MFTLAHTNRHTHIYQSQYKTEIKMLARTLYKRLEGNEQNETEMVAKIIDLKTGKSKEYIITKIPGRFCSDSEKQAILFVSAPTFRSAVH